MFVDNLEGIMCMNACLPNDYWQLAIVINSINYEGTL